MLTEKRDLGIDYSLGQSNFDPETGIKFGVISQHSVLQAWADSSEPEYPCDGCEYSQGDDECSDAECEPSGWNYDEDGYKASTCLDTDIMIIKSPFYSFGVFCSPCVPGAIDLNSPVEPNGTTKAYCFGHDWFDDEKAPYRVFRVDTGKEVFPE